MFAGGAAETTTFDRIIATVAYAVMLASVVR